MFGPHSIEVCCMTKSSNKGHISYHIWSKSAVWQSPPTRGTFWAIFGWSPLRYKVLQWGAYFGPHLVKVHCVTKSSNKGHILSHIWSKSAAWQSPLMRGTFWATFGQSPLRDKVLWWGPHFGPHLVKVRSETKSSGEAHHCFLPHLAIVCCVTTLSFSQSWVSFSCHTWPKSIAWQVFLSC
jgi:hypothetical protein